MTDLSDVLAGDIPDDEEERQRWAIGSDGEATWALRRMAAAKQEIARVTQAAHDEIDAMKAWLEAALAKPTSDAAFFEAKLVEYRRRLEADNPDLPKSYKVPGGAITRRAQPEKLEVDDEQQFIEWALAQGKDDLLRASLEIAKDNVKAAGFNVMADTGALVTEDGEHVPGVRLRRGEDKYGASPG